MVSFRGEPRIGRVIFSTTICTSKQVAQSFTGER